MWIQFDEFDISKSLVTSDGHTYSGEDDYMNEDVSMIDKSKSWKDIRYMELGRKLIFHNEDEWIFWRKNKDTNPQKNIENHNKNSKTKSKEATVSLTFGDLIDELEIQLNDKEKIKDVSTKNVFFPKLTFNDDEWSGEIVNKDGVKDIRLPKTLTKVREMSNKKHIRRKKIYRSLDSQLGINHISRSTVPETHSPSTLSFSESSARLPISHLPKKINNKVKYKLTGPTSSLEDHSLQVNNRRVRQTDFNENNVDRLKKEPFKEKLPIHHRENPRDCQDNYVMVSV